MLFWAKAKWLRVCLFTSLSGIMVCGLWWWLNSGGGEPYEVRIGWEHYLTWLLIGGLAMAFSDGLVHGVLWLCYRERYEIAFKSFADYFSEQTPLTMVVGALLAGLEELFFRGCVLFLLLEIFSGSWLIPLLGSSALFGLAHTLPTRRLAPFGLWAVWEGVLLGSLFIWSGSIWVVVSVHVLHDLFGFVGLWVVRSGGRKNANQKSMAYGGNA